MTNSIQAIESTFIPVRDDCTSPMPVLGTITNRTRCALYFRVSSNRQTIESEFEDLVEVAERDEPNRDWYRIRSLLANVVREEERRSPSSNIRTLFHVNPEIVRELADHCVYVEQGVSGTRAKKRPLFDRMKKDALDGCFQRLLVWRASRLGRDMRQLIAIICDLTDLGITVVPVKSQTGPITSSMRRFLGSIQVWFSEIENDEGAEAIRERRTQSRMERKPIGRPRLVFNHELVIALREEGLSWTQIARRTGVSVGSARRAYIAAAGELAACPAGPEEL